MMTMNNYTEEEDSDEIDKDTFLSIKEGAVNMQSEA